LNLLILEYVSGGGYANQKLSSSILSEGYGMLRSLISDCKAAGHNVTTLLDSRLKEFNPPNRADQIVPVSSSNEFYGRLKELASDAIKRVSNKMTAYETIKKTGLKVPETVLLGIHEKTDNIKQLTKELGYPLVFKPLDGVGCGGLSIVEEKEDVAGAVKKVTQESMSKQFIAQKIVRGEAASACVISTGEEAVAVTLNRQFVSLGAPDEESGYYGGAVPFEHGMKKEALRAAEKAVEGIGGLRGYVGVDMILTNEEPVVVEVNPRLTTSYVGLRRVANFNPAETIIEAAVRRKLPENVQTRGYSFFSKVEVPLRREIITETYRLEDVVSPPFPIEDKTAYALIAAASTSPEGAEKGFNHTKTRLLKLYRGD
jgi:predicted ATP-grasp superfamily ATP-dependent carboligase